MTLRRNKQPREPETIPTHLVLAAVRALLRSMEEFPAVPPPPPPPKQVSE